MNQELPANTHLSHYRIVSKLGAGGMGEVYLATDTKLDRKVALKTLPAEFAANQDRMRRFVQEAKAAAALNHPNIAHVYEIGESNGIHFIAMEYIEGITLRDKIRRDREPLQKILKYLFQVAEGLAKAHQAGIVHRDLKPDNIMITRDDYAKILDFGLAKLVEPQRAFGSNDSDSSEVATAILRQQSIPGIVMGTVGYMSPEQASGRVNEIDHRSDIFSFGCLLFEACSGKKPFEGKDALESLYKVVHSPAPQLKEANPSAPDELQRVVRRCLAKEPNKRYQSMKEVAIEIDDLQHELKTQIGLEYREPAATTGATASGSTADEGFWVAVLPFKFRGSNIDLEALAEGLSEDIVTALSRFSYLRVIARSSTLRFTSEATDVRAVGRELGARYVMEGNLRLAGSMLRVAVQLVDTTTGAHLWAEAYDRPFRSEEIFALQDDLVPQIVSTIADQYGALVHSMSESLRGRSAGQYTAHEAMLRLFGYLERMTPEEHSEVREILEAAVAAAPGHSGCHAALSVIYWHEYANGFNVRPEPLGRALAAARQAVAVGPTNHLAHSNLGTVLFFQKDFLAFRTAAERTLALNTMDTSTTALLGTLIAYAGDWEYGLDVIERATKLNPHHPGWYHFPAFHYAYHRQDYRGALASALKFNMPGYFFTHAALAAVYGQLGEQERAREALRELHALIPNFGALARQEFGKWVNAEHTELLLEGLRKAGLEIVDDDVSAKTLPSHYESVETRADDGFWVAVLPFKTLGSSIELDALSGGMTEEIITGLSRFSYVRVISQGSTSKHPTESSDIRAIGKQLGARYVMEGSIRQAGSTIRLAVQLVDATTGANLWAETFDRHFQPDQSFTLQDELVPRIVSTIADWYGVLPHSMSEALRLKAPDQLSPYEAVLRSFGYFERIAPEEHGVVRASLERAVGQAPGNADGWAMLSMMYGEEHRFGFNALPDPLGRSLQAARRAVDAAHANHFAWLALAQALFFRKEFDPFRDAAERAIALNSMDGSTLEYLGHLIAFSGDWDRGCDVAERARHLNPNHPGWYWSVPFLDAYRKGKYDTARTYLLKSFTRGGGAQLFNQALLAALYGQLGEGEAADKALREVMSLNPDFLVTIRSEFEKWYLPELVEQLMEGLAKAGLKVEKEASTSLPETETRALAESSPSIAVLPFGNLSPDPDNEYFADGLTEEVIADLSGIRALRVISRTSAMHFRGTNKDLRAIARELDVRYVLEGSVRRDRTSLRVTVQLIDAETDSHLWAEKYTGSIEDVFAIQEEISQKIVNALQLRLTDAEARGIAERPIDNAAAYDCYMRARHEVYRFTAEGLYRAQKLVDAGLSVIGENSLLLATRGMVSWYYLNFSIRPEERYLNEAAAYAVRALEQDPQNYLGIFLRGLVASKRGDIESAISDLQAAHERKAGDAIVLNELIRHHFSAGQEASESARPVYEEALRVDPLHPLNWAQGAWRHFCGGRLSECVEAAHRVFHLTEQGNPARVYAAYYLALAHEREEAIAAFEAEASALTNTAYGSMSLFLSRALQQDAEGAVTSVTPQLEQAASWTEYLALLLADGYAFIGQRDAALRWLRAAVSKGFINYPYLSTRDPFLANVRSDPRFHELMQGVKARWDALSQKADRGSDGETAISPSYRSSVAPELRHTVGREPERNELRFAFNSAKAGRGSLLCIAGEPGIGKTTLVEDFLTELATRNQGTIARGRCSERLAGTEAYLPLLEALESLLQNDQRLAPTMKQIAPTWYAQVMPLAEEGEESVRLLAEVKAASQERMKRELASFLQAVAHERPLVLFFDDLHWADVSTIDVLSFLSGKFDALKALIVTTYRPSDMLLSKHPFLQIKPDLQARGVCRELQLEFLNEAEIAQYLTLEFPLHHFPSEFPKLIHAKTEGSPLFMADLVRYLRDCNVIANTSGAWKLEQALPDIECELPESVRGMIERKIAQLSEEDRKLLVVASVQGYEFDSAVVAQVLSLDADDVEERLEKLERVFAFVKLTNQAELPDRTLTLKYRFVHVLYQNALYASLRATRKATLSRDVARALEGYYEEQRASVANDLAALYETAREYERAAEYFRLAAHQCNQISASREAIQLARRGLAMIEMLPDGRDRREQELSLQVVLGNALMATRGYAAQETEQTWSRARELCQELDDTPYLFPVLYGLCALYFTRGKHRKALEIGTEFLGLAEKRQDPAIVVAHRMMGSPQLYMGELAAARAHYERIISLYTPAQHRFLTSLYGHEPGAIACGGLSIALWLLGYPELALARSQESLQLGREVSHANSLGVALCFATMCHQMRRGKRRAFELAEETLALAAEQGLALWLSFGTILRGSALDEEHATEGVAEMRRGLEAYESTGTEMFRPYFLWLLAEGCGKAGQVREGLTVLDEAQALAEKNEERYWEAEIHRLRGQLLLMNGEPAATVEPCFHQAVEIARRQQAKSLELRAVMSLARLWRQQGKRTEARQMLEKIYGWFTEGFDTGDLKDAKALLDELQQPDSRVSSPTVTESVALDAPALGDARSIDTNSRTPSIAVLPFVNISDDPDNEYFCDGLAEELLNALSKIEGLRVAARTSAFSFKGKETDVREIGQRLNVTTVLEGGVRKSGNRLRITAQLVNINDGYHLWSERYDREMQNIFDVQDEITLAVVEALKLKLFGDEKKELLKRYTDNTEAYESYLKGRYHSHKYSAEGWKRAIEFFEQAIEIQPDYAPAYAGLANARGCLWFFGILPAAQTIPQSKADNTKALALDNNLAEAYLSLAIITFFYDWQWEKAEHEFKQSIALNPNNAETLSYYAMFLAFVGRFDEASSLNKKALKLDPLSPSINMNIGWNYFTAGNLSEASSLADKLIEMEPDFYGAYWLRGAIDLSEGDFAAAVEQLTKAVSRGGHQILLADLASAYSLAGKADEAARILDQVLAKRREYIPAICLARIYSRIGEHEKAIEWLERAFEERNGEMVFLKGEIDGAAEGDALRTLANDSRLVALLRKMKLPG